MRCRTILVLGLLMLLPIAAIGCYKRSSTSRNDLNDTNPPLPAGPAAVYQSLFRTFSRADLDALNNGELSDKVIVAHGTDIERAIEASAAATCDFGVDRSRGMSATLPHLTYARTTVRLLRDDAERLLRAGDADGAAKRTAAILRIGQQVAAASHCGMEQLVACASIITGTDLVNSHPELAHAAWKTDIQAALASVRSSGAAWSPSPLRDEGEMVARSLRTPELIYLEDAATMDAWKRKSQSEREQAALKLLAIHAEIARVWGLGDAESQLGALAERATREGVGDLFIAASRVRAAATQAKAACIKAETALK